MTSRELEQKLIEWHKSEAQSSLRKTFELGDMILDLIVLLRQCEAEVIRRITSLVGEYAMSQATYNRAARMARNIKPAQRQVLIDKMVPLDRCEVLANEHYDSRDRVRIISEIKSGKIKAPWHRILTRKDKQARRTQAIKSYGDDDMSERNPDNIIVRISQHGYIHQEGIVDCLKCLLSRCGYELVERLLNQAVMELKIKTKKAG